MPACVCGGMRSYLFELQLGPPANVGIGVEGCYYATSNGGGIHLDVKMRAFTYRGKWVGLPRGTRGKGGSLRLKACVVRLLCGLRSALRCGAVRWVNDSRLSRMHLTKIVWAGRKRATAGQRNQLQERSRGLPIRDSTLEAECLTWGSFLGLQCLLCRVLPWSTGEGQTKPQTTLFAVGIGYWLFYTG